MIEDIKEILISEQKLAAKVKEMGARISRDYDGMNPILISILKGSIVFMSDLMRAVTIPCEIDFMAVSSYNKGTKNSGVVRILKDLERDIAGRHILIVEDILDSGLTLSYLLEMLNSRDAASIKICTLLDKPARHRIEIRPEYLGFTIPDEFVVGYGLDYAEKYRNLPFIGVLRDEIIPA
jgi:hypoxanthine phosphoribosyltransferase